MCKNNRLGIKSSMAGCQGKWLAFEMCFPHIYHAFALQQDCRNNDEHNCTRLHKIQFKIQSLHSTSIKNVRSTIQLPMHANPFLSVIKLDHTNVIKKGIKPNIKI